MSGALTFQIVAALVTAALFIWLYHEFLPVLRLTINVTEKKDGMLILRLEATNISKLPARVRSGWARLQVLEHDISGMTTLSEWVPFVRDKIKKDERPTEWRDPVAVLETTKFIKPGETVTVERGHQPAFGMAVHCAFQIQVRTNFFIGLLYGHSPSFTTTRWVIPTARFGAGAESPLLEERET
jgi:hypothetical protein